jgi:phosphate transport system substrate-binding protein
MVRRTNGWTSRFQPLAGLALIGVVSSAITTPAWSAPLTLTETGSTLMYPLFQAWTPGVANVMPDLHLTLAATGSGQGIDDAINSKTNLGASDAYMGDDQKHAHPLVLNIPLVISAQTIDVNLPELHDTAVKLSGPVLAGIYAGRIHDWDDPAIAALNPGVKLPQHSIVPIRRQDASGDTFVFTQFLAFSTPAWENAANYGTSVDWPAVTAMQTATGNDGMLKQLAATPYSVGYLGGSFQADAATAGLQVAPLQNADGQFVLPTAETVTAAAAVLTPRTPPDERLTLVFAQGAQSYPLINYEYAVVTAKQSDPATAAALRDLLLWCVNPQGGSAGSFLTPLHFISLPTSIRALSESQIATIQ